MLASSLAGGSNAGFNPLYQIGGPRSIQLALKLQYGLEKTRANILRSLKAAWVKKSG